MTFPASFQQEGVWFHALSNGSTSYWNFTEHKSCNESINLDALKKSLYMVVQRHSLLKSNFKWHEDKLFQWINDPVEVSTFFEHQKFEGKSESEIDKIVTSKIISEERYEFDFERETLIRFKVLEFNTVNHFVLTISHILTDYVSMQIFWEDLDLLYDTCIHKNPEKPVALGKHYFDYCLEQADFSKTDEHERQKNYWEEKLSDRPLLLELPFYKIKSKATIHYRNIDLPTKLVQDIRVFSFKNRVLYSSVFLLAYFVLLHRYSRKNEIAIGNTINGRRGKKKCYQGVMGLLVNRVVHVQNIQGHGTLLELLNTVNLDLLDSIKNNDITHEEVLRAVNSKNKSDLAPLFNTVFNMLKEDNAISGGPKRFQKTKYDVTHVVGSTQYDMGLTIIDEGEGARVRMDLKCDEVFSPIIDLVLQNYIGILNDCVYNSQIKVKDTNKLAGAERNMLLKEFNATNVNYPAGTTVAELFEKCVDQYPENSALNYKGFSLNYGELDKKSNQLAHYLLAKGVKPEDLVGLCIHRSVEMIIGMLGIIKAGGAFVPIDPSYPRERIDFMLEDTKASVVLSSKSAAGVLQDYTGALILLDAHWESIAKESEARPSLQYDPGHLVYVIYTSGSTGKPKGVLIGQKALLDHVFGLVESANLRASKSFSFFAPLVADAGHALIFSSLLFGGLLHILSDEILHNTTGLNEYFHKNEIDCIKIVPSLWESYESNDAPLLPKKTLIFGGDTLSPGLLALLHKYDYKGTVYNHYGPTETTIGKTIHKVDLRKKYTTVPIGRPFSNTEVYIMDNAQRLLPIGVPGELCIGGAGVTRGYLNRPGLTKEKFVPNPFGTQERNRLYRTGDLVRWLPDGNIEFIGRMDNQVKIRGYRIEPGEIESAVQQSDMVRQCVVVAQDDHNGDKRLVGYVVPEGNFNQKTLIAYLAGQLPDYMIPNLWVPLEKILLTPNGKVDKKALPNIVTREWLDNPYVPPQKEKEKVLADIWRQLLAVERIGIHDNFFALGGNSLIALQFIGRLRHRNYDMDFKTIFKYRTIAKLSEHLIVLPENHKETFDKGASGSKEEERNHPHVHLLNEKQNQPILFVVPGTPGFTYGYGEIAGAFENMFCIYGIQMMGLAEGEKPLSDVKAMAEQHNTWIKQIQPKGPYRFIGHSLGAHVAFEMIRQLEEEGQVVEFFTILDASAMSLKAPGKNVKKDIPAITRQFLEDYNLIKSPSPQWLDSIETNIKTTGEVDACLAVVNLVRNEIQDCEKRGHLLQVLHTILVQSQIEYVPGEKINTRVLVIRAQEKDWNGHNEYLGWEAHCHIIRSVVAPGGHLTMIEDKNAPALVAIIKENLMNIHPTEQVAKMVSRPSKS